MLIEAVSSCMGFGELSNWMDVMKTLNQRVRVGVEDMRFQTAVCGVVVKAVTAVSSCVTSKGSDDKPEVEVFHTKLRVFNLHPPIEWRYFDVFKGMLPS